MITKGKTIIHSLIQEVWNGGKLAAVEQFYAPTIVRRQPPFPPITGLAAYRDFLATTFATFANLHMTATEIVAEGDTVVLHGTWSANQTGPVAGKSAQATGKPFEFTFIQ